MRVSDIVCSNSKSAEVLGGFLILEDCGKAQDNNSDQLPHCWTRHKEQQPVAFQCSRS